MVYATGYMRAALSSARRHIGMTGMNPSVGCIIVKDGIIVGRGITAYGGRPYAEPQALEQAGDKAGARMFMSRWNLAPITARLRLARKL